MKRNAQQELPLPNPNHRTVAGSDLKAMLADLEQQGFTMTAIDVGLRWGEPMWTVHAVASRMLTAQESYHAPQGTGYRRSAQFSD